MVDQKRSKKRLSEFDKAMVAKMRQLRKERGWSQEVLAERYGCEQSHISQRETGNRGFGTDTINHLTKAFGMDFKEFWVMPKGISSAEMETLWEKIGELQTTKEGEALNRIVDILIEGTPEEIGAIIAMSKIRKKT